MNRLRLGGVSLAAQLFVLLYCQAKKQSLVERLREAEA